MSNGGHTSPRFRIVAKPNADLQECGCSPWVYHAVTGLQFLVARRRSTKSSHWLPFRLDTGAFVSILPECWLRGPERLESFLPSISEDTIVFRTAAGEGNGNLARDVQVRFTSAPGQTYSFDFLVTKGLNRRKDREGRNYGLLSLRDVIRHFDFETDGPFRLTESGGPLQLPDLVLMPRTGWRRIRYRCPQCGIEAWGRPGYNLQCGDCARQLQTG